MKGLKNFAISISRLCFSESILIANLGLLLGGYIMGSLQIRIGGATISFNPKSVFYVVYVY